MTDPQPPAAAASGRRGRGQPPALTGARLQALLAHLADGLTIQQAAAATGIARATVYNTRDRDPAAAAALTAALAAGKAKRAAARHGSEACYTHRGCRRPECTAAATAARAQRRTAHPEPAPAATPLTALPTPAPHPAPAAAGRTTLALLAAERPLADAS
ncbi:helix-turn-helix domain-containing protein [Kitasatospora sp. NPDC004272]